MNFELSLCLCLNRFWDNVNMKSNITMNTILMNQLKLKYY